jgi:DNA-binding NarL/FixJ family response regulator
MLVEDHNLVRAGIRAVIDGQSDIQVIAEATEGREAIRLARATCPDVAVVDVAMPGMSGIEVTRDIRRLCPQTQVLILTAHDNEEYFFQTLKAGAVGYVLKKAAASDLIAAIEAASKGEPYLYPSVARLLVSDYLQRRSSRSAIVSAKSYAWWRKERPTARSPTASSSASRRCRPIAITS